MNKLDTLYNGSWITFLGVSDPEEWKSGLNDIFLKEDIGNITDWHVFTGKEFNEYVGREVMVNNLTCLAGSLDNLNVGKLACWRLSSGFGGRWFDDIVDNIKGEDNYENE